jgi:hypothetical protein
MELIVLLMLPLVLLYLLPTWIAFSNRHRSLMLVLALNLCLGWTLLGWLAALGFALWPNQHLKLQKIEA